jgi:hypothetical protein
MRQYYKKGKTVEKKKSGKKFPDLTGDGKVTRADILKGRGVFKRGGDVSKRTSPKKGESRKDRMKRNEKFDRIAEEGREKIRTRRGFRTGGDTHVTKEGKTAKKGLWYNIHQKRKRGEKMRKKGAKGAPTAEAIKKSQ